MSLSQRLLVRRTRLVAKLAAFALLSIAAAPARAQTPVNFGDTISSPGVYFLNGSQSGTGDGITIESDDVALLLLRFTLRGDSSSSGIFADGYDNITIYGGRVTQFYEGIKLRNGEYLTVRDVRIDHCGDDGLDLENVDQSLFQRLRIDHNNSHGVEAHGSDHNRFLSILTSENRFDGMRLSNFADFGGPSNDNKIRLCWAAYNGLDGIRIEESARNNVKQNQGVGNAGAGIRISTFGPDIASASSAAGEIGSEDNDVTSNWCVFNRQGIVVVRGSDDTTLTNNTALANTVHDMVDENDEPPCRSTWYLNFFLTKDGAGEDCIF